MNFKFQGYRQAKFWETLSFICLGIVLFGRCKTLEMASTWAMNPVVADGESTDWVIATGNTLNTEDGAQVNVSNDSTNLYLMIKFRANNEKWTRACAMSGLTIWLDPSGKKSTNFGVHFRAGPLPESLPRPGGISSYPMGRESIGRMWRHPLDGQLTFIDQKAGTTGSIPIDSARGPSAVFTCKSGVCTYELSLPLSAGDSGRFAIGAKPGGVMMVGLTAGMSKEEREAMSGQRGEMPGGGMGGGRPGGGFGPPGGGMGGGQRPAMSQNPELWFKVKLAPTAELGGVK